MTLGGTLLLFIFEWGQLLAALKVSNLEYGCCCLLACRCFGQVAVGVQLVFCAFDAAHIRRNGH